MSNPTGDLIVLSPCAPSQVMRSSTIRPAAPTAAVDFEPESFLQTSLPPQPRRSSESTLDHGRSVVREVASTEKDKMAEVCVESYVKKTDDVSVIRRQYGSVVVINPLPKLITKRDVLCRVRGGKVLSCILSEFCGQVLAVVTFQDPASAQLYVDFCAEISSKDLWSFTSKSDFQAFGRVDVTPRVCVYKDAPGLGIVWHPEDISSFPTAFPPSATRCLSLEHCHVKMVAKIWADLELHKSLHLQDQLDDAWLEPSLGGAAAGEGYGTLHVWYSDIKTAMRAQQLCSWLKFESDPCSIMPHDSLFSSLDDDKGQTEDGTSSVPSNLQIRHHSFHFVSLLDLHKRSVMVGLRRGDLDAYEVFGCIRTPQSEEEGSEEEDFENMNLTARLMYSLRTKGKGRKIKHARLQAKTLPQDDTSLPDYESMTTKQFILSSFECPKFDLTPAKAGYRLQFPPPMSGEPAATEHPSALGRDNSPESSVLDDLARRLKDRLEHERWVGPRRHVDYFRDWAQQNGLSADFIAGAIKAREETSKPTSTTSHPQTGANYSRENWGDGRQSRDVFWTVSLEEFKAMDDDQWKIFGTSFYVPPPGFNTAKRHVMKLPLRSASPSSR